jgi:CRISPR-associated protein Csx17
MTDPLILAGCTPEPLMGYLKALGVFRLVAEQIDPAAKMSWAGGVCRLHSTLDRDSLTDFFLKTYRPTPVLAPWNGGSGFYGGGSEPMDAIAGSTGGRFAPYRRAISSVRSLVPAAKPKDAQKEGLLHRCRAELPDEVVPWLDTCFVLGEDGPSYFPLLGTGGNDGRLDFTNNFMQRLGDVISFDDDGPTATSGDWLASALYGDSLAPLRKTAIGQFNPGGIGGANGTQGRFEADSRVNPWDFILMIEGTMLFAGSVARRLGANAAQRAVFPFAVKSVAVGYGSAAASEETTDGSRAELWLPLWGRDRPATLAEVTYLFAEGRAQLGRRQARNAVEFSLAVSLLGVSRGVTEFARYGFLKRNGLSFLATPLDRVPVTPRPKARLLDEPRLTEWLDKLRGACSDKDKTPARYQAALRRIDQAMYRFAVRSESSDASDRSALVDVLRALGRAEQTLAGGLAFSKDKYVNPLQGLSPQWLAQADDCSAEFRLAAGLAGIRGRGKLGPIRVFLEETELMGGYYRWSPGSTSAVWSKRPLAANLSVVFHRRQMEAFRDGQQGISSCSPRPAQLADVVAFLHGETDDDKLADLLWSLSAVNWSDVDPRPPDVEVDAAVPFEFGVPRLLIEPRTIVAVHPRGGGWPRWGLADGEEANINPDPDVFHVLASGQRDAVQRCVDHAARRLKSGGLLVRGYRNRRSSGRSLEVVSPIPADRLLAAMLFPLSDRELEMIANTVLFPPETQES